MSNETHIALVLVASWGLGAPAGAMDPEPPSPSPSEWSFVDALSAPLTWTPHWRRGEKKQGEASLQGGVRVEAGFPDPKGVLETAHQVSMSSSRAWECLSGSRRNGLRRSSFIVSN